MPIVFPIKTKKTELEKLKLFQIFIEEFLTKNMITLVICLNYNKYEIKNLFSEKINKTKIDYVEFKKIANNKIRKFLFKIIEI